MKRHEFIRKPHKCPECSSTRIADILYGLPAWSQELDEDLKSGKLVLGGCCITEDDPKWQCADCHTSFFHMQIQSKRTFLE